MGILRKDYILERWVYYATERKNRHIAKIDLNEQELNETSSILKKLLARLKSINTSYNLFFQYGLKGNDLHFHIEITPRIDKI